MTGPAPWRKSSRCESASCVEVALIPGHNGGALIRTSSRVVISADKAEWLAFVAGVKAGEFDWPEE